MVPAPRENGSNSEMKEGMDATAARPAPEQAQEDFVNRKLIRPSLSAPPPRTEPVSERRERMERTERTSSGGPRRNNGGPSDQTHAENYYYQKQIQSKTPVVIVLKDGEQIQGLIEWYDRNCLKVSRSGGANLLIYKPSIRYIYKAGEAQKP
jgi:host factor-I protein